jgi:hypothetical protein
MGPTAVPPAELELWRERSDVSWSLAPRLTSRYAQQPRPSANLPDARIDLEYRAVLPVPRSLAQVALQLCRPRAAEPEASGSALPAMALPEAAYAALLNPALAGSFLAAAAMAPRASGLAPGDPLGAPLSSSAQPAAAATSFWPAEAPGSRSDCKLRARALARLNARRSQPAAGRADVACCPCHRSQTQARRLPSPVRRRAPQPALRAPTLQPLLLPWLRCTLRAWARLGLSRPGSRGRAAPPPPQGRCHPATPTVRRFGSCCCSSCSEVS